MSGAYTKTPTPEPSTTSSCDCANTSRPIRPSRSTCSQCEASVIASSPIPPNYFPTRCSTSLLFSVQTYSSNSVSGTYRNSYFAVHGFAYAPGSSIVVSRSIVPKFRRCHFSVTRNCSVCGCPPESIQLLSFCPAVSITSVSPSQCPTEYPSHDGCISSGNFRPSINTSRNVRTASNKNVICVGLCRIL